MVTVFCTASVCVGLRELDIVIVVVGTLATDLVPRSVRQVMEDVCADAKETTSGRIARAWRMEFMLNRLWKQNAKRAWSSIVIML